MHRGTTRDNNTFKIRDHRTNTGHLTFESEIYEHLKGKFIPSVDTDSLLERYRVRTLDSR